MTRTSLACRAVAAALVVFLHYVPQIKLYMDDGERYFGRWGLGNVARTAIGVLLLTAAALATDGLLRRWAPAWVIRIWQHLFLVALLSGGLAAFVTDPSKHEVIVAAAWCIGLVVIAGSLCWRRSRLVHYASVLCLIFSPLIPILFGEMLFWPRWDEPLDPLPASSPHSAVVSPTYSSRSAVTSPDPATPVFIFVFDEWSWPRSSCDGQFTVEFPHLQALSKEATVYRTALSPFRETGQSLPRFIFQTDREFTIHDGRTWFKTPLAQGEGQGGRPDISPLPPGEGPAVKETPTQDCPSLFQPFHNAGYRTYLLGFHHAYRHMLGGQIDVCRSYFAGDEAGPAEKLGDELLENTRTWSDPFSRRYVAPLADKLDVKNWRAMVHRYRDDMLRVLAECPPRSLVVCHVPLPHAPFVFNADGSDRPTDTIDDTGNWDDYHQHLLYADVVVGEIVDTLRDAGKYDNSLLIITSDHSWRADPDPVYPQSPDWVGRVFLAIKLPWLESPMSAAIRESLVRRVPLVIKLPGQRSPPSVDKTFHTNQLMPILESVLSANANKRNQMLHASP